MELVHHIPENHMRKSACSVAALAAALIVLLSAGLAAADMSSAGSLLTARGLHTATLLPAGNVLVTGGYIGSNLATCELYNASSKTWGTTGALASARSYHTATLLPSGKILVTGGWNGGLGAMSSCEIYDPTAGTWSVASDLATGRYWHTATLLASGKVLVAGGRTDSGDVASCELYDPAAGTWSPTAALATARDWHTATVLPSGMVLVTGGNSGNSFDYLASCEIFDPNTATWSATGSLAMGRDSHTATLLPLGKVLVAGGWNLGCMASCEIWDSNSGLWSSTGSLATSRQIHTATLLPTGKVLVTGGRESGSGDYLASCELYDPGAATWSGTASLSTERGYQTATQLSSDIVLVTGGYNGNWVATSELYDPNGVTLIPQAISGFTAFTAKTYGDSAWSIAGVTGGASGEPVLFSSDNPGVATITGSTVTITGAGTTTITATQAGNALYLPAPDVAQILTVSRAAQTISGFPRHGARIYGDAIDMSGVVGGSSGNPVVLSSDDLDVATVSGTTVRLVGAGSVVITATQAGNVNYDPAAPETYSILANPAMLTVTAADASRPFGASNPSFAGTLVGVIAGDAITASYASSATPATPAGSYGPTTPEAITPTLHDPGARLGNYTVSVINGTLSIGKLGQAISGFTGFTAKTYGDSAWSIAGVTGGASGEPVLFSSDNPGVATVSGNTVTITGAGTATITASQIGTTNYTAATPVLRTLTVSPAALAVTAADASRAAGAANPVFTGSLVGVVGADAITATFTSSATAATPSGIYGPTSPEAITPVLHDPGSRLSNYSVSITRGTLTISPVGGSNGATSGGGGGGGCGVGGALALLLGIIAISGLRRRTR